MFGDEDEAFVDVVSLSRNSRFGHLAQCFQLHCCRSLASVETRKYYMF